MLVWVSSEFRTLIRERTGGWVEGPGNRTLVRHFPDRLMHSK